MKLPDGEAALAEAGRLADAVRAGGGRVVHVRHVGEAGGAFDPDHPRGDFIAACAPKQGEAVGSKGLPNSFAGTDLANVLGAPVGRLILACFMTHICVSATARAALDLGYGPAVIVADACATRDMPHPTEEGKVIGARALHEMELATGGTG